MDIRGSTLTEFDTFIKTEKTLSMSPGLKSDASVLNSESDTIEVTTEQVQAEMQLDELLRGLSQHHAMGAHAERTVITSPASLPSSAGCPPSNNRFSFSGVQVDTPVSSPTASDVEEPAEQIVATAIKEPVIAVSRRDKCSKKPYIRDGRLSSNDEDIPDGVRLPQRKGGMHLWQFLYAMLRDRETRYANLIEWTRNEKDLEFRLLEPEAIAVWWGHHKNKCNMSYDKLSRSLRYYYDKGIIRKINGERYVYRFCIDPEVMYKHIGNSENRPQLKPMPETAKRAMSQFQSNGTDYNSQHVTVSPKAPLVAQEADLLQGRRKRVSPDQMTYHATSYPAYYTDCRPMYEHTYVPAPTSSYPPPAKRSNSVELYATYSDPFAPYAGSTICYQRDCMSLPSYSYTSQLVDPSSPSPYSTHYPPISNSPELLLAPVNGASMSDNSTAHFSAIGTLTSTSSDVLSSYSPSCSTSLSPSVNDTFPMFSSPVNGVTASTSSWSESQEANQLDNHCVESPPIGEDQYFLSSLVPAATGVSYQWSGEFTTPEFDLNLLNH